MALRLQPSSRGKRGGWAPTPTTAAWKYHGEVLTHLSDSGSLQWMEWAEALHPIQKRIAWRGSDGVETWSNTKINLLHPYCICFIVTVDW
jgi:hypothetical protein